MPPSIRQSIASLREKLSLSGLSNCSTAVENSPEESIIGEKRQSLPQLWPRIEFWPSGLTPACETVNSFYYSATPTGSAAAIAANFLSFMITADRNLNLRIYEGSHPCPEDYDRLQEIMDCTRGTDRCLVVKADDFCCAKCVLDMRRAGQPVCLPQLLWNPS